MSNSIQPTSLTSPHTNALVFCSDENVLPYALYAASHAAILNPDRNFDILICSLSPLNIPKHFLDLGIIPVHLDIHDRMINQGIKVKRLTITTYLRLWLSEQLVHTYERIYYVDTDTDVVDSNLSDFTRLDLGPHAIGGVRDIAQWAEIDRAVHEFDVRKMTGGAYVNAGVLLIDTEEFNSRDLLNRMLETYRTMAPFIHNDQSLVNLTLRHEWAELHPNWNWQGSRLYRRLTEQAKPRVIHFVGPEKPYDTNGKQKLYSQGDIANYAAFLSKHFPEMKRPTLPSDLAILRWFREQKHDRIANKTEESLKPLFSRFKDDLEVLT